MTLYLLCATWNISQECLFQIINSMIYICAKKNSFYCNRIYFNSAYKLLEGVASDLFKEKKKKKLDKRRNSTNS